MNRIPPNLLYLTIYNPTLQPTVIVDGDNEDAEEQAHILFYTSKERAVSRDRMLRQIGLAKAIVNFVECVSDPGVVRIMWIDRGWMVDCSTQMTLVTTFTRNRGE
jgi:hypothetical protein